MTIGRHAVAWLLPLLLVVPMLTTVASAQSGAPAPGTVAPSAIKEQDRYSKEELGQMLAPIALYPDQLVAQILMASTFPDQIQAADTWLQNPANAALKGDALVEALQPLNWDPSVKSIAAFPQIVKLLNDNMDLTQGLGQAFTSQQDEVWAEVQTLRAQAQKAGNLKSNEHILVTNDGPNVVIAPADPMVLTVPYYNPAVVYGPWLYPAYPPVFFPPVYFGIGPLAIGVGWGWGPAWPIYGPLWGWYGVHWGFGGGVFINSVGYSRISYGHRGWVGRGHWARRGGFRRTTFRSGVRGAGPRTGIHRGTGTLRGTGTHRGTGTLRGTGTHRGTGTLRGTGTHRGTGTLRGTGTHRSTGTLRGTGTHRGAGTLHPRTGGTGGTRRGGGGGGGGGSRHHH